MAVNKIFRGGNAHYEQIDGEAAEALTPGELVEPDGTASDTFQAHTGADGPTAAHFVRARKSLGETINDDVPAGEYVRTALAAPGCLVYAFLDAGESVSPGTFLVSAGNGNLQAYSTDTIDTSTGNVYEVDQYNIVGVATEALDLSGSAERGRLNIMVV